MKILEKPNKNILYRNVLLRLFNLELVFAEISGWLREMGGKNSEKDHSIHSYYFKLDGKFINSVFQKISGIY